MSSRYDSLASSIEGMAEFVASAAFMHVDYTLVRVRHSRITDMWRQLNAVHLELFSRSEKKLADTYKERLYELDDVYIEALATSRDRMDELKLVYPID